MTSADGAVKPMSQMLAAMGQVDTIESKLDQLNQVKFDTFKDSLQAMIDKMMEVVDTSGEMVGSMKSNSGFAITGTIQKSTSNQQTGNQGKISATNIKIGTQNNYKTGESARSLRNALASN
jgi:hypothetical protein